MYTHCRYPILLLLSTAAFGVAVCLAGAEGVDTPQAPRVFIKNQGFLPFAGAPINYRSEDLDDPVARLQKRLERNEVALDYQPRHGYLKAVLAALHIPISSQTLVFSKTSFQFPDITPATPRALYYNDDVYVGQVHSGRFLEFVSFDPVQGAIFYIMDEHQVAHPRFERSETDCIQCHVGTSTRGVPGVMLRSVFTRSSGYPAAGAPSYITGQESPLGQRWGGWYVTALGGAQGGMANAIVTNPRRPEEIDRAAGANLRSLSSRIDTGAYLADSSDVVALLVLAHQTQMHNLITQTNYETRLAFFAPGFQDKTAGQSAASLSAEARKRFEEPAEQLVRYLLFTNEAPLPERVVGTSKFAAEFAARGPWDARGRSLRDFDLRTRIFKYPCSYLIYSEDFNAIPQPAKDLIYRRLFEVLSGNDRSPEFSSLSSEDRRSILEILVDTKPGLPENWKQFLGQPNGIRASVAAARRQFQQ